MISRDYISRGLRSRAEDLVAIELGPKPEHEIRSSLEREVTAERWTRLDQEIRLAADETGYIDLRPENSGSSDPEIRRGMVGRLQHLEKMGLAASAAPGEWIVGLEAERNLRDLGMRGDIIKTMHRAFTERGDARGVSNYVIEVGPPASQIVGRLVDRGLHDELAGEAYAVIDGTDGRAPHVRFRGIEAFDMPRRSAELSKCDTSVKPAIRAPPWCSRPVPISISGNRSRRKGRPGSTTGWSNAIRCRSPWADSVGRAATLWKPVPSI